MGASLLCIMRKGTMKYWRWFCFILSLGLLSCVPFTQADDLSTNAATDAWIPWGESSCVSNDDVLFSLWPDWMVSAFKIGGAWDTNLPAWVVEEGDTNESSLNIDVDRIRLTNNVLMRLDYMDHSNATLMLDLYEFTGTNTPDEPVFTSNLFNNLISGGGGVTSRTFTIPFGLYTNVVGIRLRRDAGAMTVFDTLLSSDRDGDGYADSEELTWGSDPDSAWSVPCASITGQVFYAGVQTGVIHVLATTNSSDWASAYYLTLGIPGVYTLAGLPLRKTWYPRAYRDVNGNGIPDDWEPCGGFLAPTGANSLVLTGNTSGVNITLTDPDSDGDGMIDVSERALGLDPYTSNTFARLPFLERFETNTVHLGDVNGQNGWTASPSNTVLVQTSVVWEGSQALALKSGDTPADVRQLFAVSNAPVVWVDVHGQAWPSAIPTNAASDSAWMFFDTDGYLKVYDGLRASSNKWVSLTNVPSSGTTGAWVRLSTRLDYSAQRWLVCVDGVLASEGLGFASPVSQFNMVSLKGERGGIDALCVSTNEPAGLSFDGDRMPDDWEMANFGNLDQTDAGDADQDGLSNLEEYRHGTDPNVADSDHDGMLDGWEVVHGLNPSNSADAALDADGDGLNNLQEYQLGMDPRNPDTDHDGLSDGVEVNTSHCEQTISVVVSVSDLHLDDDGWTLNLRGVYRDNGQLVTNATPLPILSNTTDVHTVASRTLYLPLGQTVFFTITRDEVGQWHGMDEYVVNFVPTGANAAAWVPRIDNSALTNVLYYGSDGSNPNPDGLEWNFDILKVDIEQAETNVCKKMTSASVNLSADSYGGGGSGSFAWTNMPAGLSNVVISADCKTFTFNPNNSAPGEYVVKAWSSLLTNCYDTCTVRVLKVDLNIYNGKNGSKIAEDVETSDGAIFLVNCDDDNGNMVPDFNQAETTVEDENDLAKLDLSVAPSLQYCRMEDISTR
jgi:Bacterial TSP3 repeat